MNKTLLGAGVALSILVLGACSSESTNTENVESQNIEQAMQEEIADLERDTGVFADELAEKVASIVETEDSSEEINLRADELDKIAAGMIRKAELLKLNAKELSEAAEVLRHEAHSLN